MTEYTRKDKAMSGRWILTIVAAIALLAFTITCCGCIIWVASLGKLETETLVALYSQLIGFIMLVASWYFHQKDRTNGNGDSKDPVPKP